MLQSIHKEYDTIKLSNFCHESQIKRDIEKKINKKRTAVY